MGESMPAAGTTGGSAYRCTRGNCGADIGHPVNQEEHNAMAHSLMTNGQTPDEGYAEEKADTARYWTDETRGICSSGGFVVNSPYG